MGWVNVWLAAATCRPPRGGRQVVLVAPLAEPSRTVRAVFTRQVQIRTGTGETVHDLTEDCERFLAEATGQHAGDQPPSGLLNVWVPHATAGLAVLETGAGSDTDLLAALRDLLPADDRWRHRHGSPGHGRDHVLPALLAPSLCVPVVDGRMTLGTWQSVCLVDTNGDNPVRKVRFSLLVSG